ncbi:ADP-ribosylglycohydrolase family protein [soil metagenome]
MTTAALEALVDEAAATSVDDAVLKDRYRGVLLGVAVGNALGIPAEGESQHAIRRHWPQRLTEIDHEELDRPWDDDLAQTVLLAEALLRTEDLNLDFLAQELVRWKQENGRGMGLLTRDVIAELESGEPALEAARIVWDRSGWSTAGNGAVMRCAPVALRWRRSGTHLVRSARTSAAVTHHDARCEWSTVAADVALASLLSGASPDLARLASALEQLAGGDTETVAIEQVAEAVRSVEGSSLDGLELDDPMDMGYTLKAMSVALWCSFQAADLEAVVVDVVNGGGDTDTNGAVAGAVMGARVGAEGIPQRWLGNIPRADELTAIADRLFEASQASDR